MTTPRAQAPNLSGEQLSELLGLLEGRERRAQADHSRVRPAIGHRGPTTRSARLAGPPGGVLRHPRPGAQPAGPGRSGPAGPAKGRRLGREAAARRPGRAPPDAPWFTELRRRGRRHARRVRVLGIAQGPVERIARPRGARRRTPHPQTVQEGATSVLRRPRTRRARPRRSGSPGADQRPQAEVRPRGLRAPPGRRAVVLPGRFPHPRAVDQVPARQGLPSGRRGQGLPHRAGRRPVGRATNQDPHDPRVLARARSETPDTRSA
jgi:hypothetical protein